MSLKRKTLKAYQDQLTLVPMPKKETKKIIPLQREEPQRFYPEIIDPVDEWYETKPKKRSKRYYQKRNMLLLDGTFFVIMIAMGIYFIYRLIMW